MRFHNATGAPVMIADLSLSFIFCPSQARTVMTAQEAKRQVGQTRTARSTSSNGAAPPAEHDEQLGAALPHP
jgi:hypothetical protein